MPKLWRTTCCGAHVDDYKTVECPDCGAECETEAADIGFDEEEPHMTLAQQREAWGGENGGDGRDD